MGRNAIRALAYLRNNEQLLSGVLIDVFAVADIDQERLASAVAYFADLEEPAPRAFSNSDDAIRYIAYAASREPHSPVIIYDATPPQFRFQYFRMVYDRWLESGRSLRLYFLGEKPFFTDSSQVEDVLRYDRDFQFFSDLIETENPVVRALRTYLRSENTAITSMSFWRADSTAVKRRLGIDRYGIMGGALLDQAPHDISVSVSLLGAHGLRYSVHDAELLRLVTDADGRFLTCRNRFVDKYDTDLQHRSMWPADALSTVGIRWTTNEGIDVPADYLFSWIGRSGLNPEAEFGAKLVSQGFSFEQHQHLIQWNATTDSLRGQIEELRLGLIQCSDRAIVCNFLSRSHDDTHLRRFGLVFKDGQLVESLPVDDRIMDAPDEDIKHRDLAEMFRLVIASASGRDAVGAVERFGRHVTTLVHSVVLDAQLAAVKRCPDAVAASPQMGVGSLMSQKVQPVCQPGAIPTLRGGQDEER